MNQSSLLSTHYHNQQQQPSHHQASLSYKFANYHSMTLMSESMSSQSDNVGQNISVLNESFNDLNTSQTSMGVNSSNASQSFIMSSPHSSSNHPNSGSSTSAPHSMVYYIILHGQIKPKSEDSSLDKFVTKYDSDGKFIYLEPE